MYQEQKQLIINQTCLFYLLYQLGTGGQTLETDPVQGVYLCFIFSLISSPHDLSHLLHFVMRAGLPIMVSSWLSISYLGLKLLLQYSHAFYQEVSLPV